MKLYPGLLVTALVLAAALAPPPEGVVVTLPGGDRVEWRRGGQPVLLALPRPGEGWLDLAERLAGSRDRAAALRSANPSTPAPLRDVRVRVPWEVLSGTRRLEAARALFPADRRVDDGWEHVVVAPFGGEAESWWELAERYCGDGTRYPRLRGANPGSGHTRTFTIALSWGLSAERTPGWDACCTRSRKATRGSTCGASAFTGASPAGSISARPTETCPRFTKRL